MIRQVDKPRFNIQLSSHPERHRELSWCATEDDAILGVVLFDLVDKDYLWLVLTENDRGPGYSASVIGTSHGTGEDATAALHDAMRSARGNR